MLYIMGESWYWIKQRPHFIAEYLSKYYETDLVFEKRYTNRVDNKIPEHIKCHEVFKLPKTHNPFVKRANSYLIKKELKKVLSGKKYDFILFNNYNHFNLVKDAISDDDFIVYDCMDDFTEFKGSKRDEKTLEDILKKERALYERSDVIVFSSEYLKERLRKRYGEKKNSLVINNAIEISSLNYGNELPETLAKMFVEGRKNLCYVGSVSDWFDFEILLEMLERFKEVNFILVGPTDTNIPKHDRLKWHGQIEYRYVMNVMKRADLLVMPFKVDELVKSVNPVKVYEYIYSGVPALVVKYKETEKFKDFVYLYNYPQAGGLSYSETKEEFFEVIRKVTDGKLESLCTNDEALKFAEENTWERRVKVLKDYIEGRMKK